MGKRKRKRRPVFIRTQREPSRACPVCARKLDASTGTSVDVDQPGPMRPGAITVCAYCKVVLTLTDAGLRLATDEEFSDLDPMLQQMIGEYAKGKGGAA